MKPTLEELLDGLAQKWRPHRAWLRSAKVEGCWEVAKMTPGGIMLEEWTGRSAWKAVVAAHDATVSPKENLGIITELEDLLEKYR